MFRQLRSFSAVEVTGADAGSFLQNLLTGDVEKLTRERAMVTAWATPQGRVAFCFVLLTIADGFLLLIPTARHEALCRRLELYRLRAHVEIKGAGNAWRVALHVDDTASASHDRYTVSRDEGDNRLAVTPDGGRLWLQVARDEFADDAPPADDVITQRWGELMVHNADPLCSCEAEEQYLPQTLNLDVLGGLSHTKGCYPGQEIVTRVRTRGQLKRRMQLMRVAPDVHVTSDMPLFHAGIEATQGYIIAVAESVDGHIVLAAAPWPASPSDTLLTREGALLTPVEMPYTLPSSG
ncbi:MAG: folate-binding protein YgfZ [Gammaproteobacteria bacterium]|nr:folate-binding protein YgfZ [Gammaproteobacteria bacterium]